MAAGPMVTTQIDGKMQSTSGNTIFTPVFAAASSARWRRFVRSVSEYTRSDCATLVPNLSVWISIVTSELRSSTPVRSARLRSASERALPARSSRLISFSSSAEIGIRESELGADAGHGLIEAEAGFDADDEQVERVGERQADAVRAALGQPREDHARAAGSRSARPPSASIVFGRMTSEVESSAKSVTREQDADAEEDRQRLVAAVAGLHQAQAQRAHLLRRAGHFVADALEQR